MAFERERFLLIRENQKNIKRVNVLTVEETKRLLSVATDYDVYETGGFLRKIIPSLTSRYGAVQQALAVKHFNDLRELDNIDTVFKAIAPKLDEVAKTNGIIDYAMSLRYNKGFESMVTTLQNEITRATSSYNHDTITYNSALDETVVSVQRVAEAGACAFCSMMALNSYNYTTTEKGLPSSQDFAVDYHNLCHCSIETIYKGQSTIQPEYYEKMQEEYTSAEKTLYEESLAKQAELGYETRKDFLKDNPEYSATTKNIARIFREQTDRA